MPFIDEILKHKSLSIVGMEKNTGKTECLNYIIDRVKESGKKIAVTSIGIDGESVDILKNIKKPEIELYEDIIFLTSENHYKCKTITAEILDISTRKTPLGRLITARSINRGKVVFSGPSETKWLAFCIKNLQAYDVNTTIVDGALSRISHASPAITECMILTTGAAVSTNLNQIIKKTLFTCNLLKIPAVTKEIHDLISGFENGIYALSETGEFKKLSFSSSFLIEKHKEELLKYSHTIYFTGILTDKVLRYLSIIDTFNDVKIIVRDFTCLFITPEALSFFKKQGGQLFVLYSTRLIAVCVNPISPDGFKLDSLRLQSELSKALELPVYDIKNLRN